MKGSHYFPHDFDSRQDPKIENLMVSEGITGYGIYWGILEELYKAGGRLPISEYKRIAFVLHVQYKSITSVIQNYGLFENNGELFWSDSVIKRIEDRNLTSKKRQESVNKRWNKENEEDENSPTDTPNAEKYKTDTNELQLYYNSILNNKNNIELTNVNSCDNNKLLSPMNINACACEGEKACLKHVVDLYTAYLVPKLPKILRLSDKRKQKIRVRLEEMGSTEVLEQVFQKIAASKFLTGDNHTGWKASFDWIFENESNWVKVIEGNYDDSVSSTTTENINDEWK